MKRIVMGVGVLAALVAVGVLMAGCGQERRDAVVQAEPAGSVVVAQPASVEPAGTSAGSPASGGAADGETPGLAGALAPEIEVEAPDSRIQRGQVLELVAYGSEDVTEMVLGDDRGEQQTFAYDVNAKRWTTHYRVPLKSKHEKLALSVTGRNASQRWRRVWLFLTPQEEGVVEATATGAAEGHVGGEPASTGGTGETPADSLPPRER